jgi:hypothetical protein
VRRGVDKGELRADVDPEATAVFAIAAIEGGLLLAQASGDPSKIDPVIDHLERYVRSLTTGDGGTS